MPFLQSKQHNSKKSTAHSLRANLDTSQGGQNILSRCRLLKRVSLIIFRSRGSMTLEAAFVLPFFLFAVINILFAVSMIGTQSRVNAALHQTGNKMAFAGYVYEKSAGGVLPDSLAGAALTSLYARGQILEYTGREYLEQSCVVGGAGGVSLAGSSVMEEGDIIDLQVSYRVTRYVSDLKEEDPMVYITKAGTVYHVNRNCTYLNPSVEMTSVEAVTDRRNPSGAKYHPCELCDGELAQGQVYITSQGNRYHSRIQCSGLKRTIYTVPLSEVHEKGVCSKCG